VAPGGELSICGFILKAGFSDRQGKMAKELRRDLANSESTQRGWYSEGVRSLLLLARRHRKVFSSVASFDVGAEALRAFAASVLEMRSYPAVQVKG
jgi:hypothetical protein